MNIGKIQLINLKMYDTNNFAKKQSANYYGLKMPAQLQYDTVTFNAKKGRKALQAAKAAAKYAEEKAAALEEEIKSDGVTVKELPAEQKIWKINKREAETIHKMILKPQSYIKSFIHDLYDDLLHSEKNPRNPILEIHDRPKSVESIIEKTATRKWKSVKEVLENMTDLNGVKIVARKKSGKDEMDSILDRLVPMITSGQLEIKEIELKRPEAIKNLSMKEQEAYDYASMSMLKRLVEVQEKYWNTKNTSKENLRHVDFNPKKPQYTKGNYCAIHLLLDLPNKEARVFEAQFMGAYVGAGKILDDIIFKIIDGKHVDKKYTPIVQLFKELKDDTTGAFERFKKYRKEALFALRKKEIHEEATNKTTGKNVKLFISAEKHNLTPEYDLNSLLALKNECDKLAEIRANKAKQVKEENITAELKEASFTVEIVNSFIPKKTKEKHRGKWH